ncbi:MAG: hypothetical protein WC478_03810 [Candidatus Omnitrophota bacterium]
MEKKKFLIWVAVVVVAVFSLGIIKDQLIKGVVTITASTVTGAPVHIDGFSLGFFSQSVKIKGFRMYNPRGFSRGILADLPTINVKLDTGALFRRKLHLVNVEVELKELGIEKNREGKLNVDALKVADEGKKEKAGETKPMPLQIDTLKLGMGRVVSKDYSGGGEPIVNVYAINIQKGYKNITSVQQLAALILAEPMKSAGIRGAKIYGASMLAGVAVLPLTAALTFAGKDSAQEEFGLPFDRVYDAGLGVLKQKGQVSRDDRPAGVISASLNGADITLRFVRKSGNSVQVTASARKYLLPKPEIAAGVLYDISERLK